MYCITARNVNDALFLGMNYLSKSGVPRPSRNGMVLVAPFPVTTCYRMPTERVLFNEVRDANPFFHFFEALWMLTGANDVKVPAHFASNMLNYSDDGETLNGAYGHRWRKAFDRDQLDIIVVRLMSDTDDRRCVLQMWDESRDLDIKSKDVCCNTHVYFSINLNGALDMTVCCRSNDMIWGAYGANAVHFSMLQEYMAGRIGVPVGFYWQISNNFHAYTDVIAKMGPGILDPVQQLYADPFMSTASIYSEGFDGWCQCIIADIRSGIRTPRHPEMSDFFRHTAYPMLEAHDLYKTAPNEHMANMAAEYASKMIAAPDWRIACVQWLERRARARAEQPTQYV